ncbi:GAF and ANTAR domain-containing protein [Rhodococcus sp. NBC_00294]|uniref:GAF and ANTAR domain-containing protein n=1 Tax=Rhodococcus sp. NBC_00294 TaxID=2976004 RepID=UPI002E2A31FB|nr:GAF and ANTAR domain-containing protein [Rhodococcus sp. NBC_00294]
MNSSDSLPLAVVIGNAVRSLSAAGTDDDHAAELMHRLVDAACACIPDTDMCGVTVELNGAPFAAATSSTTVSAIDLEQYDADSGPCLHAAREGETVLVDCEAGDARWPEFGTTARAAGIAAMMCTPVRVGDRTIGSLTLFAHTPHSFDDLDRQVLSTLVGAVSDALERHDQHRDLSTTVDGLRDAMAHRAPIEQAKGILMALRGIDDAAAFEVLSTESQRTNRRLRDIAREFVSSVTDVAPAEMTGARPT